jgi:hypothetical protein
MLAGAIVGDEFVLPSATTPDHYGPIITKLRQDSAATIFPGSARDA